MHFHLTMRINGDEPEMIWQGSDPNMLIGVWENLAALSHSMGAKLIEDVEGESFAWRIYALGEDTVFSHTLWKCDAPNPAEVAHLN